MTDAVNKILQTYARDNDRLTRERDAALRAKSYWEFAVLLLVASCFLIFSLNQPKFDMMVVLLMFIALPTYIAIQKARSLPPSPAEEQNHKEHV